MAPQLRPRTRQVKPASYATAHTGLHIPSGPLPVYEIDLSLPPAQRYVQAALDFKSELEDLKVLFHQLLNAVPLPNCLLHFLARFFLTRVYSEEEMQELNGIGQATGLAMYLLVAYNIFLDLFMGCTSGGVRVQPSASQRTRMMHFRTLDWGMPQLRNVLAQFDFVERPGACVVARTVGYVGFVGVLTGLRKDLTVSLNFRPYHNNDGSPWSNFEFLIHQLAVLLGFRPSIASILRDFIIPRTEPRENAYKVNVPFQHVSSQPRYLQSDICSTLPSIPTTAAYLVFCNRDETIILEKDLRTANILRSSSFVATTNHDVCYEDDSDTERTQISHIAHAAAGKPRFLNLGMDVLVEESIARKRCLAERWRTWSKLSRREMRTTKKDSEHMKKGVELGLLQEWLQEYPVTNEDTHFSCIMDPNHGTIQRIRKYEEGEVQ